MAERELKTLNINRTDVISVSGEKQRKDERRRAGKEEERKEETLIKDASEVNLSLLCCFSRMWIDRIIIVQL